MTEASPDKIKPVAAPRKKRQLSPKQLKKGKGDLVEALRRDTGIPKDEALLMVNAMLNEVRTVLLQGGSFGLAGIGTLAVKTTPPRSGPLPGSIETFSAPDRRRVTFKVSKKLKRDL